MKVDGLSNCLISSVKNKLFQFQNHILIWSWRSPGVKWDGPSRTVHLSGTVHFFNYKMSFLSPLFWPDWISILVLKIIVIVQSSRKHPGWSPNLLLNFWPAHLIWHSSNVISLVRSPCSLTFCRNVRARGGPKLAQCQDLVLFIPFRRAFALTYNLQTYTRRLNILLDRFIDFTFSPRF